MGAERIQCDYDQMSAVADLFGRQAAETEALTREISRCVGNLQQGGWLGLGAQSFYDEMLDLVFPALGRLSGALHEGEQTSIKISQMLADAEEEAAKLFRNGSSGPLDQPAIVPSDVPPHYFDSRRRPYTFKNSTGGEYRFLTRGPKGPKFSTMPAIIHEVVIDGQTIRIIEPADANTGLGFRPTAEEVAKALAVLPPEARKHIKEVVIEPTPQVDPKDPKSRVLASHYKNTIHIFPTASARNQGQLDGTMIHESGHGLSDATFGPWNAKDPSAGWKEYMEAAKKDHRSVSAYGNTDGKEDFSEMFVIYQRFKGTPEEAKFKAYYPNRWAMMDKVMQRNK